MGAGGGCCTRQYEAYDVSNDFQHYDPPGVSCLDSRLACSLGVGEDFLDLFLR